LASKKGQHGGHLLLLGLDVLHELTLDVGQQPTTDVLQPRLPRSGMGVAQSTHADGPGFDGDVLVLSSVELFEETDRVGSAVGQLDGNLAGIKVDGGENNGWCVHGVHDHKQFHTSAKLLRPVKQAF
jgi:hypothetical protein